MKKLLYTSLFTLLGLGTLWGQPLIVPSTSTTPTICISGSNTQQTATVFILDQNSGDGKDVAYTWTNADGLLTLLSPTSGTIPDGGWMSISMDFEAATGASAGGTSILEIMADNGVGTSTKQFLVTFNDYPSLSITTPDGTESCNGNLIQLQANVQAGVTGIYNWSNGETTQSIYVSADGTYTVTVSNSCTAAPQTPPTASVTTTSEVTPTLTTDLCQNANNQLTFNVSASDSDNAGIVFSFHEGDPGSAELTNGGDYAITTTATTASLVVSNVNPAHQATNFYAKAANSCGTALSAACLALPIELEYFTARYEGGKVQLDWATATETNNEYFSIERSVDGEKFEEIARIPGAGTSYFTIAYAYTDESVKALEQQGVQSVYYRLKQTDFDGSFSYAPLISVVLRDTKPLIIEGISVQGSNQLLFNLQSGSQGESSVTIHRMDGHTLFAAPMFLEAGAREYTLHLNQSLPSGLYLLRIENKQQMALKKFVVIR